MKTPIVCFSHLRWGFTFQRPNHLMSHFARDRRVFYVEEPIFEGSTSHMEIQRVTANLTICTPHWPDTDAGRSEATQARRIAEFFAAEQIVDPILWFYTPMALPLASRLDGSVIVYDCMDELSLFFDAPKELIERERALLEQADIVFTGGQSLYESKRHRHPSVHAFPSSVDIHHFAAKDNTGGPEPHDLQRIGTPRVGFFGVIDERMDLELVRQVARQRPMYQFLFIGPVVKISEHSLPRAENIHYLGPKPYVELPRYLHRWDVAIMPFALNDSTRFISPTKTLEYLAGGKPVVSTAVKDVVVPYARIGAVRIADRDDFAIALDEALTDRPTAAYRKTIAGILRDTSWDKTWRDMCALIEPLERVHRRVVAHVRSNSAEKGAAECTTT